MRDRRVLSVGVLSMLVLMAILLIRDSDSLKTRAMATFDTGKLTITDVVNGSQPVYQVGLPQTFKIAASNNSVQCDLPGVSPHQRIRLLKVDVMLEVVPIGQSVPAHCFHMNNIEVELRRAPFDDPIAATNLSLYVPTGPAGEWATADFEGKNVLLEPGVTYYLAVNYLASKVSPVFSMSSGASITHALGTPVTTGSLGGMSGGLIPVGGPSGNCPSAVPTFGVFWKSNSQNPYADGSYYSASATDTAAVLSYKYSHQVNVAAIIYDPNIATVNYVDLLSPQYPIPSFGVNKRLHRVLGELGIMDGAMRDPWVLASSLEETLEMASGGTVDFVLTIIDVDDWSWHVPSIITFGSPQVISIPGFTKWTKDTWPCYKQIPRDIDIGGQRVLRRACFPEGIGAMNYNKVFEVDIDGKTLFDAVNDGEIDDVWVFADPTGGFAESVMAVGTSNLKLNNVAPVQIVQGQETLQRNVPVMGFDFSLPIDRALHSYGHRTETIMASLLKGNMKPNCTINNSDQTLWGKFKRIYDCHEDAGTPIPAGKVGGVGSIHKAWNVPVPPDPTLRSPIARQQSTAVATNYAVARGNYDALDVDSWTETAPSDEQDWFYFPNFPGKVHDISCVVYGCTPEGYYAWWYQHIPRYAEVPNNDVPENLWPFISSPGCFQTSRIPTPGDSLTPSPGTPQVTSSPTP